MPTTIVLPCPRCSSTGTDTHEDRHADTRMDTCPECKGARVIASRTGETPEAAFQPAPPEEGADGSGA